MDKDLLNPTITKEQELFAKKVTSHLGKNPQVRPVVAHRLFSARNMALSSINRPLEIKPSQVQVQGSKNWFQKQSSNVLNVLNGVLAFTLMFALIPVGLSISDQDFGGKKVQQVGYVMDSEEYFLNNIYHQNADNLSEDYLQENGFI